MARIYIESLITKYMVKFLRRYFTSSFSGDTLRRVPQTRLYVESLKLDFIVESLTQDCILSLTNETQSISGEAFI